MPRDHPSTILKMSCDSGLGSSEDSQISKQELSTGGDCDGPDDRETASQAEGQRSLSVTSDASEHATPVENEKGNSQLDQVSGTF